MLENLMVKMESILTGVTFTSIKNTPQDMRVDCETFTHEIGHLVSILGVKKTKSLLAESMRNNSKIRLNDMIHSKFKTIKAMDNNEIKTTAITILAMDQLGGGDFRESMNSMCGNLQSVQVKLKKQDIINNCVALMMTDKIQSTANTMVKMLLELEFELKLVPTIDN